MLSTMCWQGVYKLLSPRALSNVVSQRIMLRSLTTPTNTEIAKKFYAAFLKSKWWPNASFDRVAQKLAKVNPSSEWDDNHLYAFNFHFLHIEKEEDWKVYICPPANLTPDAIELSNYKPSPNDFRAGAHEKPPHNQDSYLLRKFGNLIGEYYARIGSEAVVDKLADLLVDICNCDREVLQSASKLPMNMKVCNVHYISTITNPELGTDVSFYCADFSEAYIKSVIGGNPSGNVVVFKYSGGGDRGIDITFCSAQRTLVLEVLCSIISFCLKEVVPYVNARPVMCVFPQTAARLELLQDLDKL